MMSPEQLARVETAIERAQVPGDPRYVVNGEPSCFVAQLAALEGVAVERIATWGGSVGGLGKVAPELRRYPLFLLDRLQLSWSDPHRSAAVLRERMRARVQRWLEGERGDAWDEMRWR